MISVSGVISASSAGSNLRSWVDVIGYTVAFLQIQCFLLGCICSLRRTIYVVSDLHGVMSYEADSDGYGLAVV